MPISTNLYKRAQALPRKHHHGLDVVENFGVLVEIHQDIGGVPTFLASPLRRGWCVPTLVHFDPNGWRLMHAETGELIPVHDRHRFMPLADWSRFVMDWTLSNGTMPVRSGQMLTARLRDFRQHRNYLVTFRNIMASHDHKGAQRRSYP